MDQISNNNFDDFVKKMQPLLRHALGLDRYRVRREINRIKRRDPESLHNEKMLKRLVKLERQLHASKRKKTWRKEHRPRPTYNYPLPIIEKKDDIVSAIKNHPVLIISGETGSGKTTQIPKFCIDAGRGIDGKIGCTQPRRIAAVTVANRIAYELGDKVGNSIGYKIRFADKTRKDTFIKIMTDGIMLAETQKDPLLYEYDTIIVDEAHERSLNIDFVLGILKTVLKKRKGLKLIITSATIDTEKFSRAFNNAPVIEVSGRMYPVDVKYMGTEKDSEDSDGPSYVEKAIEAVDSLQRTHPYGDILIFMPTEQDILEAQELIRGKKYRNVSVMPLFARLSGSDQTKIFLKMPGRKIIIATNIAETSITIPGIKYVIDTGLARIPRYTPRTRITSLLVSPISKSSADQRKGRCGRIEAGLCIRLYPEEDYNLRPVYTLPEILRANLAEVILKMVALNLGDVSDFPFIDHPAPKSITDGFDLLIELGAITHQKPKNRSKDKARFMLTPKGRLMSHIPVDPRLSCILIEAQQQGCLKEILVIASALSVMDPRERPFEKIKTADEAHAAFKDRSSDFLTLLNIWDRYHETWQQAKSNHQMKKFCKKYFLSFKRMREWRDIHSQLSAILKETGFNDTKRIQKENRNALDENHPLYTAIHKSILSGFLSNIATKTENNIYKAAKGHEVMIFPGSSLFNKARPWVVAAEIVETNRVYGRTAAAINSGWLEKLGKNLCKYNYLNPHWDKNRGEVIASEQVSLFGLIIVEDRRVSYGRIQPGEAQKIFIQNALVEGDVDKPLPFMKHNQRLIDHVRDIENRLRRRDVLISRTAIFSFYKQRLEGCFDIRTLKQLLREKKDDKFLRMNQNDLFQYTPNHDELSLYPDRISLGNQSFASEYHFEPGGKNDGLTVTIPSIIAPSIPPDEMGWLVPGLYKQKIAALIKGLPKSYRKQLVPVADTVNIISAEMSKESISLITAIGNFIYERFGIDIPASAWSADTLPEYLKMRISITGHKGKEIASGRDQSILTRIHAGSENVKGLDPIRKKWEKTGLTRWNFPDLPASIQFKKNDGTSWTLFPALTPGEKDEKDRPQKADLRLFSNPTKALAAHKAGVAALYTNRFSKDLKFLKKNLGLPITLKEQTQYFGGKKSIEKRLHDQVIHRLFFKNIRSKTDFDAHAESSAPLILSKGQELLNQAAPVFKAFSDTRTALSRLKTETRFNPVTLQLIEELETQTEKLVPENFIELYDASRLAHIGRYLKAILIRAQRALVDHEKDRKKSKETKAYTDKLEELLRSLTPEASDDKRDALEELFWLIEEYKVSVFAQELKTALTVSKKRIDDKIREIQRMV